MFVHPFQYEIFDDINGITNDVLKENVFMFVYTFYTVRYPYVIVILF